MPGPTKRSNQHLAKIGKKIHLGEDLAPSLLTKIPDPPITLNPVGQKKWVEVCDLLLEQEVLTAWDLSQLEVMCLEFQRYIDAIEDIKKLGEYFTTGNGYECKRPASVVRNQAFLNYTRLLRRFGGDVAARAGMKRIRPQIAKSNPFADI